MCLFCKIAAKEIPSSVVFENENIIAFNDINPQAPVHILIIPKKHIATFNDVTKEDLAVIGEIYSVIPEIAKMAGIAEEGYRVVGNCNKNGGQEVYHIHFHLMGGRKFLWPAG